MSLYSTKTKVLAFIRGIRDWLKTNISAKPESVIYHLNPLLRGWGNYYQHGVSKRVFSYVDNEVWKALWRWCCRRHPNKGRNWIARKYYISHKGRQWTFHATVISRNGKPQTITLMKLSDIPIQRHVKVKGKASPDDSSLRDYWRNRQTRYGKTYWAKGSKYYIVAENQKWRCPVCGDSLFNGETLHTHHLVSIKNGGNDQANNLTHLHRACHQQVHSGGGPELLKA